MLFVRQPYFIKVVFMTDRKNWKCALSVGPNEMCAEEMAKLAGAGIEELELSSGQIEPYFSKLDYTRRSREYSELA